MYTVEKTFISLRWVPNRSIVKLQIGKKLFSGPFSLFKINPVSPLGTFPGCCHYYRCASTSGKLIPLTTRPSPSFPSSILTGSKHIHVFHRCRVCEFYILQFFCVFILLMDENNSYRDILNHQLAHLISFYL